MVVRLVSWLVILLPGWAAALPGGDDAFEDERQRLASSNHRTRRAAVEALAKLDEVRAWDLVVDALEDPVGEVADTAQWFLGGLPNRAEHADLVKRLEGRDGLGHKDALRRERVAEVLGRLPGQVEAETLRKALSDRDSRVRRIAAASVARRGQEGLGGDSSKLVRDLRRAVGRDRDPRAAGEALIAWATLDPPTALAWWGTQTPARVDLAVRCAAARAAATLGLTETALTRLAQGGGRALDLEVIDALSRTGTPLACAALTDFLESEEAGVARRALGHLRDLSGRKYGLDVRPWRDWVAALGPDWRAPPPTERGRVDAVLGGSRAALVGLPILSQRVTFLIDLSGSMWEERDGGVTRKQVVDARLRECLEALGADTRFNLIPYTRDPIPWKEALQPAGPRNVAAALTWFERRTERGPGNVWDALVLALEDPEVDTVVMLGDGAPSGGDRYRFELLADLIDRENLGRSVVVDSILVDARGHKTRQTWAEIARRTGGRTLEVSLK